MKNIAKSAITARFSPRACLGAIGAKLHSLDLLAPVKAKESRQNKLTNFSASVFVLGCEMQKR